MPAGKTAVLQAERKVRINTPQGLHLRMAASVVRLVKNLRARLTVDAGWERPAQANSVIDLLRLGATRGTQVTVRAVGEDAEEAVRQVGELFSDGGGI